MGEPSDAAVTDEKMDDLVDLMKCSSSLNAYTATEKHPHFDNYKNVGKIATSQKERRVEHLERQKERRNASFNRQRAILENIDEKEEEQEEEGEDEIEYVMEVDKIKNPFQLKNIPINKRYKDQLMLSEWLIDIPNELQGSWTMVVSPRGKRCLVVAKDGITKVFSKHGYCTEQFKSGIPGGGSDAAAPNEKTILDCICFKRQKTFYILDLIYANKKSFKDIEATERFKQLEEIAKKINPRNFYERFPYFSPAPRCPCNADAMTKMLSEPMKQYDISGLLFYNNDGWYTSGYTPLVGWLEPWMLPEVLNIPIHDCYKRKRYNLPLKEYVDDFNNKHNHHYIHGRPWEEKTKEVEENQEKIVTD